MKELVQMDDASVSLFIKKCCLEKVSEEEAAAPLDLSKIPESFKISDSTNRLYNV